MLDFVTQLTETTFKTKANFLDKSSSIQFENFVFKRGPTFSWEMREQALKYCQNLQTKQLKSLLVEGEYTLTIWIQIKTTDLAIAKAKSEMVTNQAQNNDTQSHSQQLSNTTNSIPMKKVVRQYRGQTYEIKVPDHAAMKKVEENQLKPRRKYRGQYIN